MTVDAGGAPAPVSDAVIPTGDAAVSAPNAINNDGGPANVDAPAEPAGGKGAKPVSIDDALDRATAKVDAKAAGTDPKDPTKGGTLVRDEKSGKFVPKDPAAAKEGKEPAASAKPVPTAAAKPGDQPGAVKDPATPAAKPAAAVDPNTPKHVAPARFSEDAKAVWDGAPEPVKAEVARMERELTQGIEKHRAVATKYEAIREYDELATKSGTDLKTALSKYVNLEQLLRKDVVAGLGEICKNAGVSLRDVAAHVMGQTPDQVHSQSEATIRRLEQQVEQLTQQVGGVTSHFQQQGDAQLQEHIAKWAEAPQRKDIFELYAPHIAAEMRDGAANLDDAELRVFQKYPALAALAKPTAKPAAVPDPAEASAAAAAALEAQTLKGSKSINGAPSHGSNPAAKKRSQSIDDAIDAAFAAAG